MTVRAIDTQLSTTYVRFVDILYVVTLGRAFLEISDTLNFPTNLMSSALASVPFLLFIFSITIVGRDWVDYHVDISIRPHRHWSRFLLDIVILFFFFQLTRSYQRPSVFFLAVAGYFLTVLCWTVFEGREYPEKERRRHKLDVGYNIGYVGAAILLSSLSSGLVGTALNVMIIVGLIVFLAAGWWRKRLARST